MEIVQKFVTKSDCYNDGKYIEPKGLMLHSVGCPQDDSLVFYRTWNKSKGSACVHAVIGSDGVVLQLLPWTKRAWHCGGAGNNTHIGIEMVEPKFIKYKGGSNWTVVDGHSLDEVEDFIKKIYKYAVELFAFLCFEYKLEPLSDGVVVSHSEGCKRGIASNHGDVEHLWSRFGITMNDFRQDVFNCLQSILGVANKSEINLNKVETDTLIMGKPDSSLQQCVMTLNNHGVGAKYIDLVSTYFEEASYEGVRPDIALAQSCLETGWFTFKGDVKEEQNNYAGMGATGNGVAGESYPTPELGIRAQIQHLKAYASTDELSKECVDKRFKYVVRGSAKTVESLSIPNNILGKGWASDNDYASKILKIMDEFKSTKCFSSSSSSSSNVNQGDQINSQDKATTTTQANKIEPYMVKVTVSNLNIRQSPNGKVVGSILDRGVYTIIEVDESGEWGRLKSGAGWIFLGYTNRL